MFFYENVIFAWRQVICKPMVCVAEEIYFSHTYSLYHYYFFPLVGEGVPLPLWLQRNRRFNRATPCRGDHWSPARCHCVPPAMHNTYRHCEPCGARRGNLNRKTSKDFNISARKSKLFTLMLFTNSNKYDILILCVPKGVADSNWIPIETENSLGHIPRLFLRNKSKKGETQCWKERIC